MPGHADRETLLFANQPITGLDYIESALLSGRLTSPAQIVSRRLRATAKWMLGDNRNHALETLDAIQKLEHSDSLTR